MKPDPSPRLRFFARRPFFEKSLLSSLLLLNSSPKTRLFYATETPRVIIITFVCVSSWCRPQINRGFFFIFYGTSSASSRTAQTSFSSNLTYYQYITGLLNTKTAKFVYFCLAFCSALSIAASATEALFSLPTSIAAAATLIRLSLICSTSWSCSWSM